MKTFRWLSFGFVIAIAGCSSPSTSTTPSTSIAPIAPIAQVSSPAVAELPSPVWEVNWRVCNVINPSQASQRGCLPDMNVANQPDRLERKVVFWADNIQSPEDIHIETVNSFMLGVQSYLFVRSKGCINRPPGAEDFYYTGIQARLSTRRLDPPLPEAQWTVTAQQLTSEEATPLVQQAQRPAPSRSYRLMGTTGVCLPLAEWKER